MNSNERYLRMITARDERIKQLNNIVGFINDGVSSLYMDVISDFIINLAPKPPMKVPIAYTNTIIFECPNCGYHVGHKQPFCLNCGQAIQEEE